MPTIRQEKLAKALIENTMREVPFNKKELLVSVGYDETTAIATPGRTIEQKGVQEALENLGFSIEGADAVVKEILYSKRTPPRVRISAAQEIYKRLDAYAPEKTVNLDVIKEYKDQSPDSLAIKDKYEEELRKSLL